MKVKAYYTINETERRTMDNIVIKTNCTICNGEYKKEMYINAQSFGGSCINCRPKYLNKINQIKKNGLR